MSDSSQRLFFALWPTRQVRQALLQSYRANTDFCALGKAVAMANLHITLHYLGDTLPADWHCFIRQARSVRFEPFELILDRLGGFQRAAVSWIAPEITPPELGNLHHRLGKSIRHCGFTPEPRVYCPHVTMARKVKCAIKPQPIAPVTWQVQAFVLLHSRSTRQGVEYHEIERFEASA